MSTMTYITMGAALLVLGAIVAIFNRLTVLSRRCDRAFADVDVQLKQRHDLVPNLVESVKGYARHERGTLEAVMQARTLAMSANTPSSQMHAEAKLAAKLGQLIAVAEAYPELKASANFAQLTEALGDLEDKISAARRFLNNAVAEYNASLEQIPANIVAMIFALQPKTFFDLGEEGRARLQAAPAVQF